ncbi:MAG: hypothetical protein GC162_04990 [Planctomycetes bacterium]|nr:hypothetical protein [Planctomycetota bacterium]
MMHTAACGLALLVLVFLVPACTEKTTDKPGDLPEHVTLSELATHGSDGTVTPTTVPLTNAAPMAAPVVNAPPARLVVQMLVLPRNDPRTLIATRSLDAPAFDAELMQRWRDNGFGLGVMDRDRVGLFTANLPPRFSAPVFRMPPSGTYNPLTLVDRLAGIQQVAYVDQAGSPQVLKLIGGEQQLLVRLEAPLDKIGPLRIDLLPHHYGPSPTLIPRNPQSKLLDGTSFDALRLYQPLDPNVIYALWANLPPEEKPDSDAASKPEKPDPQPQSLAQAMLSGTRRNQPVQLVILFGLEK